MEFPAWWSAQLSKLTDAYAGNAGAFAGLARGSRLLYEPDGRVLLDQHLPGGAAATASAAASDAAHAAVIHRAIGWLIGLPPEDAVGELRRRTTTTGRNLTAAAQHPLDGNRGHTPDPAP